MSEREAKQSVNGTESLKEFQEPEEIVVDASNIAPERAERIEDLQSEEVETDVKVNESSIREAQAEGVESVPNKAIKELTADERNVILSNYRNGIENQYYKVISLKNGNTRILKKKKPSISQQAVANKGAVTINEKKVYMTNEQLLWQHVLDLQEKYNRLHYKHKKLKGKYNDLYVEDVVEDTNVVVDTNPKDDDTNNQRSHDTDPTPASTPASTPNIPRNWRSQLRNQNIYLN